MMHEATKLWDDVESANLKESTVKEALIDAWFDGNSTSQYHPNKSGRASSFAMGVIEEMKSNSVIK